MGTLVRQLGPDDVQAYRRIRLEALKNHPRSYGETYQEAQERPAAEFSDAIERTGMFGAFAEGELCAIASFVPSGRKTSRHVGQIFQMYVKDPFQGQGIGLRLLETIFEAARSRVRQIILSVGTQNIPALALYKKAGFETYGTEPRALCVDNHYIDHYLMVKFLDQKDS